MSRDLSEQLQCLQHSVDSIVSWRDQSINSLGNGLQALKEKLSVITNHLVGLRRNAKASTEKLEKLWKLYEPRGWLRKVELKIDDAALKELEDMKKEFLNELSSLRKLMEHPASQHAYNCEVESSSSADVEVAETETHQMVEVVTNENGVLAVPIRNTVSDHVECGDQIIRSVENDLQALGESENAEIVQLQTQRPSREIIIDENNRLRLEFNRLKESVKAVNEEVSNLKELVKLAEMKLGERQEQLITVLQQYQHLSKHITDENSNRESLQVEKICTAVESIDKVISSWPEMLKRSTRETSEELETPACMERLQELYEQVAEMLSAKSVAAKLFQCDVLSIAELQKVQFLSTPTEAALYLLDRLIHKRNEVAYNCFLDALKDTNQGRLYRWLTNSDYDIDTKHVGLIRQTYTFLLSHIEPTNLIAPLYEKDIVDLHERQLIESGDGSVIQVERLLSVLIRKSSDQFDQFLKALHQTGQSYVADALRLQPPIQCSGLSAESVLLREDSCPESTATGTAVQVIGANEGNVSGLTVLDDELFVFICGSRGRVEVYNATDYTFTRLFHFQELYGSVRGLTSCCIHKFLYVSYSPQYIFRVEPTGKNVIKWQTGVMPQGLSVNSRRNLLVACSLPPVLIEYTKDGHLIRTICLKRDVAPRQAIQINDNQFLVSHVGSLHRVCKVGISGQVLQWYGSIRGCSIGQLEEPANLAVDRRNGCIFVADKDNNRIVVLDSSLKWTRDLQVDGGVKKPYLLYCDERRSQLFVGEDNDVYSRVFVVKIQ